MTFGKTGDETFAVLIPSRGRADVLRKTLQAQPWMNAPQYWIGCDDAEKTRAGYKVLMRQYPNISWVWISNPKGWVSVARQRLKEAVEDEGYPDFYITADDNARYKRDLPSTLVDAAVEWSPPNGQNVLMGAMHKTQEHFDKKKIEEARNGDPPYSSYDGRSSIVIAQPRDFYEDYAHDEEQPNGDDYDFCIQALLRGFDLRVCHEASFSKPRLKKGGMGTANERVIKTAMSIARMCQKYPWLYGHRWPPCQWAQLKKYGPDSPQEMAGMTVSMFGTIKKGNQ